MEYAMEYRMEYAMKHGMESIHQFMGLEELITSKLFEMIKLLINKAINLNIANKVNNITNYYNYYNYYIERSYCTSCIV